MGQYLETLQRAHVARHAKFFPPPPRAPRAKPTAPPATEEEVVLALAPPSPPPPPPLPTEPYVSVKRIATIDIQRIACHVMGVSLRDLKSPFRDAHVVRRRQVAMYAALTISRSTLPTTGRLFGGRDHTTVLHARNRVRGLILFSDGEVISWLTKIAAAARAMGIEVPDPLWSADPGMIDFCVRTTLALPPTDANPPPAG